MKKKNIFLILIIILLFNIQFVYSSWLDPSKYEIDEYSFKISDNFEYKSVTGELTHDEWLDGNYDVNYSQIRVFIYNQSEYTEFKESLENSTIYYVLEYNETSTFYKTYNSTSGHKRNITFGTYKIDENTYILFILEHSTNQNSYNFENDVNTLKGMINSMEVNKSIFKYFM